MTQTIIKRNSDSVDIYYHPNNSRASYKDSQSRYKYTVEVKKFTLVDFLDLVNDLAQDSDNDYLQEEIQIISKLLRESYKKSGRSHIWMITKSTSSDIDLSKIYHLTKSDAMAEASTFMC